MCETCFATTGEPVASSHQRRELGPRCTQAYVPQKGASWEPGDPHGSTLCCYEALLSETDASQRQDQQQARCDGISCAPANSSSSCVTASQRASAVDGMIAAAASLGLCNDALFLGVACLDKYLAAVQITPHLLQPLTIACLWIAAKYENAITPRVEVFASLMVDAAGNSLGAAATSIKLLVMLEAGVLSTLDFRLASIVTTKQHKHGIFQVLWADPPTAAAAVSMSQQQQLYSLTSYLTEVSLMEVQLLPSPPSQVAAAAYALAQVLLGMHLDYDLLSKVTGHTFQQLHSTLQMLCALHTTLSQAMANGKPYAVSVKYSSAVVYGVARVAPLVAADDPRLAA